MIHIESLERKLNRIRREQGLIGGQLHVTAREKKGERIEAYISLKHFNIEFGLDPNLDTIWGKEANIKNYARETGLTDVVIDVCKKVMLHEIWHWKNDDIVGDIGCPMDIIHAGKILDATYRALEDKGIFKKLKDENQRKGLASEMRNLFEDVVVNTNLSFTQESDGLAIVYYDAGMDKKQYGSPLAEGFFRLQMKIWGSPNDCELLQRFYTKNAEQEKKITTVVNAALEDMLIAKQKLPEIILKFRDPPQWPNMAYELTKHLADLIDDPEDAAKGLGIPSMGGHGNKNGKSSPGDKQEDDVEDSGKGQHLAPQIAESLDGEIGPEGERKIVQAFYGEGMGPPSFMPIKKVMKLAYEHFAHNVVIQAKTSDPGFKMPIAPIRHEPFTLHEHDVQEIDFTKIIFDPESIFPNRMNFQVPNDHYDVEIPYTKKHERLPDIMFLFDCSGSMNDSPGEMFKGAVPWSEDSKYHYTLLGAFGAIKWLRSTRLAPYLKINVVPFSNTTRPSGWKAYGQLEDALDKFWTPEFGGTEINMDKLSHELHVPSAVILMLSDGEINNWSVIRDQFRSVTSKHQLSFIQIKGTSQTKKDAENWGVQTYTVNKSADLNNLMIDLTKQAYMRHASGL